MMAVTGERRGMPRYDFILIAVILLLTLLGLVTLYSASFLFAANQPQRFASGWDPLSGNFAACIMMLALFPILALIPLEWLKKGWVVVFLVFITIGLNLLPFFKPFQREDSAMRWVILKKGVGFQPSELIKVVLPLYLAYILDKNREKLNVFVYGPLPPFVVTALFCALVLIQSNFSDAVLIALTSMAICFISGIRVRWFVLALLLVIPAAYAVTLSDPGGVRYQRIKTFLSKEESPPELKTQIDFSVEAIKAGGFWGKGIGQGGLKIRMPEVHGDFVFASFVEESGFLGVLFYLALVGVFAAISYMTAWMDKNRFIQFLSFGLVTPIVVQTLMNIAVVARIIPTTGVPLPFVSSGGSSLLVTLAGAALIVNMARGYAKSDNRGGRHAG
ncbi:MAG: FtsW/RodA/SpoVE family cell cycle protein [Treponema sp.]|jgi:cell division protein FtsW|nr:FtsW/RodA/SpoVE family cell cycle protein [Treponema sp.]